jgi:hypothetical protein
VVVVDGPGGLATGHEPDELGNRISKTGADLRPVVEPEPHVDGLANELGAALLRDQRQTLQLAIPILGQPDVGRHRAAHDDTMVSSRAPEVNTSRSPFAGISDPPSTEPYLHRGIAASRPKAVVISSFLD